MPEPLSPAEASRRAKHILEHGTLRYTRHALEQMQQDHLTPHDIERALRGLVEPAEWENQQWRYRFSAFRVWAVASFRGEDLLVLVTAWRSNR